MKKLFKITTMQAICYFFCISTPYAEISDSNCQGPKQNFKCTSRINKSWEWRDKDSNTAIIELSDNDNVSITYNEEFVGDFPAVIHSSFSHSFGTQDEIDFSTTNFSLPIKGTTFEITLTEIHPSVKGEKSVSTVTVNSFEHTIETDASEQPIVPAITGESTNTQTTGQTTETTDQTTNLPSQTTNLPGQDNNSEASPTTTTTTPSLTN